MNLNETIIFFLEKAIIDVAEKLASNLGEAEKEVAAAFKKKGGCIKGEKRI